MYSLIKYSQLIIVFSCVVETSYMSVKAEKPTLTGARIKTRKRGKSTITYRLL